jgi:hypothetical protein
LLTSNNSVEESIKLLHVELLPVPVEPIIHSTGISYSYIIDEVSIMVLSSIDVILTSIWPVSSSINVILTFTGTGLTMVLTLIGKVLSSSIFNSKA